MQAVLLNEHVVMAVHLAQLASISVITPLTVLGSAEHALAELMMRFASSARQFCHGSKAYHSSEGP